ncbi:MAG: alanine racemase [Lachnospiraceae bacterium]|nr:alanine racemase [Lachnospiraceae bacterium]
MQQNTIQAIASTYGTPTYIFDIHALSRQVKLIRDRLPQGTLLCFAMKANPFVAGRIAKMVDRLEVCSPGEYEICIREQIDPEKIVVSGVNKTPESMERILSYSHGAGIYTIESELHYRILKQCANKIDKRLKVLLRLSSGNQFGMDEATLERLLAVIQSDNLMDIVGIHYYAGTQKKMSRVENELQQLDSYGTHLKQSYGLGNMELEYGPGLMVSYFEDCNDTEAESFDAGTQLDTLKGLLSAMSAYNCISIELGRFLTSDCGYYMTRIMDIKHTGKTGFIIVDGGIHQINYYGQMMGMKKPYMDIIKMPDSTEAADGKWTVCGSLCTVNDVIVRQIELNDIGIGDILLFKRCGAYSMTEGMSLFLSRELPQVLLVDLDEKIHVMRKKIETNQLNGRMEEI